MQRLLTIIFAAIGWIAAMGQDSISLGIVTCYPGGDIYELEGHTALRIKGMMHGRPMDIAMNYGLFDFDAPNFVYRFVKGETDYMCGAIDWDI